MLPLSCTSQMNGTDVVKTTNLNLEESVFAMNPHSLTITLSFILFKMTTLYKPYTNIKIKGVLWSSVEMDKEGEGEVCRGGKKRNNRCLG